MNAYVRQGKVGVRVGCLGILLYLVAWCVTLIPRIAIYGVRVVLQRRRQVKQDQTWKDMRTNLESDLYQVRDQALAEAAPGWQRTQLTYWYSVAIPAFLDKKFSDKPDPESERRYIQALRSIDSLRSIRLMDCPNCGADQQVWGKNCSFCQKPVGVPPRK